MRRRALWLDLSLKSALVGLLLFAVARPDLPQFEGKAVVARALLWPRGAASSAEADRRTSLRRA